MTRKNLALAVSLCILTSPAFAQPVLSVTPAGIQSGNWVWNVDVTPDLVLAGGDTPMAVELGFRLTSAPLLSVTNVNSTEWDTNNPGQVIFGWETLYSGFPEGIEANCSGCTITNATAGQAATIVPGTNNEIFVAMGSVDFTTPGAKPFLQIVAQGPGNGGPSSSTIQWLGAYAMGKGRIAQLTSPVTSENFDLYAGTVTQSVPEPASVALLALGAIGGLITSRRRRVALVEQA